MYFLVRSYFDSFNLPYFRVVLWLHSFVLNYQTLEPIYIIFTLQAIIIIVIAAESNLYCWLLKPEHQFCKIKILF